MPAKRVAILVAGSLANASPAIWRVGNGGQQHCRRAGGPGLGCDFVCQLEIP